MTLSLTCRYCGGRLRRGEAHQQIDGECFPTPDQNATEAERRAAWAVRNRARRGMAMPWEQDGLLHPMLADAMDRMAAVRGTAVLLMFYRDCEELHHRMDAARGEGGPLIHEEAEPIIRGYYTELVELYDSTYAQRFLRLWVMLSDYLVAVEKGSAARAALRKQIARVARR